jgi:hypothetical protein
MMSQTSGYINVFISMMNNMKSPEQGNLVFYKMTKPSSKKIQHQAGD